MTSASEHSKNDSAKTSKKPPGKQPESDFLSSERGTTRRAIRTSTKRLKHLGGEMKSAVGRHPFLLAGVGVVVGAGATALVVWRMRARSSQKTTASAEHEKSASNGQSNHLWLRLLSIPLKAAASAWVQRLAGSSPESDDAKEPSPENSSASN